ncbi:helix-turn-helix domain-containing protein [bacterium]|nr:helix-turn-helix domain-containing protein [bacterium]
MMVLIIKLIMVLFKLFFLDRSDMAMEILTLRQQLAVFKQSIKRPNVKFKDRLFWVAVSRFWWKWADVLIIVKPITVLRWHKNLFNYYWRLKCKSKGRPKIPEEIRNLIKQMRHENPLWRAEKIWDELILLGYDLG